MNVLLAVLTVYLSIGFGVALTITSIVCGMDKEKKSTRVIIAMFFVLTLFWVFFLGNPIEVKHDND